MTRIVFYIKIEVRSSLIFFAIVILGIAIAALKIRYILTYFPVPFILYMVCRPISSFTAYKALFALIAVLMVRGVVLIVRGVVSSVGRVVLLVSIKWLNFWFSVTVYRDWGFNVANKASKSSSGLKVGWFTSWYILACSKELIVEYYVVLKVLC